MAQILYNRLDLFLHGPRLSMATPTRLPLFSSCVLFYLDIHHRRLILVPVQHRHSNAHNPHLKTETHWPNLDHEHTEQHGSSRPVRPDMVPTRAFCAAVTCDYHLTVYRPAKTPHLLSSYPDCPGCTSPGNSTPSMGLQVFLYLLCSVVLTSLQLARSDTY